MSNALVGEVFQKVIKEVCDASEVDFEESGVDQQTLEDLKKSWEKKLSSLGVAQFPWDTPPPSHTQLQNQQALHPTTTVPSNAPRAQPTAHPQQHIPPQQSHPQYQHPQHPQHPQHVPHPQSMPPNGPPLQAPTPVGASGAYPTGPSPQIKTEPGLNSHPSLPPMSHMMNIPPSAQSARERATNLIQQRYGAAAANSVSQMQAQSQPPMGIPRPAGMQHMQPMQQMQQMPNGQGHQIKQETGYHPVPHPSVSNAQTDGVTGDALSEWKAEVARRREASADGEGDRALRDHLKQRMLDLEGGGLMVPLDERESQPKTSLSASAGPSSKSKAQFDGPGGDDTKEEDDEDAINSDLDDPDDLVAQDEDDDDAVGQVMLCTYDKVQRVKNKWKCTLKDGILTTGGREYVFHKGQGEFEW
ncbi:transcription factor IIA, alpha/beta subunit [Aspergillus multicolor]|uniref:transcription initiation factor IIA large subunit n=1 Tax=Aspergillus multicolor TaxID=41759 RepID=UPI003CCCCCBC